MGEVLGSIVLVVGIIVALVVVVVNVLLPLLLNRRHRKMSSPSPDICICPICGMRFISEDVLKWHTRTTHNGPISFVH